MISGTDISAFGASQIERATIEAYLATDYRAPADRPLVLHIGRRNAELIALYQYLAVDSASFLTAWNPYSIPQTEPENRAAQQQLLAALDRLGVRHRPALGADPSGLWPPEESCLALGIDIETAADLGRRFRQNGIVWAGADAVPRLFLLR